MDEPMTSELFAPRVGERFVATAPGEQPLELVLSSCEQAGGAAPAGAGRVPFALLFHAPDGRLVPQQTCTLSHPELGELALFIVPLGGDERGMRYEAVFA